MSHPIFIMALVFTLMAVGVLGAVILRFGEKESRSKLLGIVALELPLWIGAYYCLRLPVDAVVKATLQDAQAGYLFVQTFYAPVTEEPAKLLVLLIPALRLGVTRKNLSFAALAIGLGFGVGEAWGVASLIAASGHFSNLPWYQFTGFLNERFMVCVCHSGFTGVCLYLALEKERRITGLIVAVVLHYLANFPIYLCGPAVLNLPQATAQTIVGLWVMICFFASAIFLISIHGERKPLFDKLLGQAKCPNCDKLFKRSWLGFNAGFKRLEKCPHCRQWVRTVQWKGEQEPDEDDRASRAPRD